MHRVWKYVAVLLVYLFFPGTVEASEFLVSSLASGGVVTTRHEAPLQGPSDERNCSGLFHACTCHVSGAAALEANGSHIVAPAVQGRGPVEQSTLLLPSGHPMSLFRPPIFSWIPTR